MKARIPQPILSAVVCLTIFNLSLTTQAVDMSYGTTAKAKHIVGCILGIIDRLTPYIMLALIVLGGLKWLASKEDRSERIMGKKYIEMAIIGFICVTGLMFVATVLGVPPLPDCVKGTVSEVPGIAGGFPELRCPDEIQIADDQCQTGGGYV